MNAKDQQKVLEAGFTIIRADFTNLRIKEKTIHSIDGWCTFEKGFASKAAVIRRMKALLTDSQIIED